MRHRTHLLLLALAAAGCAKSTVKPPAAFNAPAAVAVFHGYMHDRPGELRSYVAVASLAGADLRFIDAADNRMILAPAPVGSLAVPTEQRPALLASSSLYDELVPGTPAQADLLVVGFRGLLPDSTGTVFSSRLQVVSTWDVQTRIAFEIDLGSVGALADAEVVAMSAAAVPGADGVTPVPGRARLYVALTGGQLAVIDFARGGSGGGIVQSGPPVVQALQFEPLALALEPSGVPVVATGGPTTLTRPDSTRLYIATTDPIPGPGGVFGVAELDLTSGPPYAVRALKAGVASSAGLPTVGVAALRYGQFTGFGPNSGQDTFSDPVLRVFAIPAPGSCGRDAALPCGLLVIDPATATLATDPATQNPAPYQAPIRIPGEALSVVAFGLSARPAALSFVVIAPGSGQRRTTGQLAVLSTAGRIYLVDPGHFSVANDISMLDGTNRTRPVLATSAPAPDYVPGTPSTLIGVWDPATVEDTPTHTSVPTLGAAAATFVTVTPGFTTSEIWSFTYQGPLPGLLARPAVALATGTGLTWLAVQEATGLAPPAELRGVGRLYDPRLGVRVNDIAEVDATGVKTAPGGEVEACPLGPFDLRVSGLLPPSSDHPGGAITVAVASGDSQPRWTRTSTGWARDTSEAASQADPRCLDALSGGQAVLLTVLSGDMVAVGSVSGYSGRPGLVEKADDVRIVAPFAVQYVDESTLACPILGDRDDDWPPSPTAVAACEADQPTCRQQCERLLLDRHARRLNYVTDYCPPGDSTTPCAHNWPTSVFPNPAGPVIQLKLGLLDSQNQVPTRDNPLARPARGTSFVVSTSSGLAPTSRSPFSGSLSTASVLPTGLAFFDRALATGDVNQGVWAYASYADQLVLALSFGESQGSEIILR